MSELKIFPADSSVAQLQTTDAAQIGLELGPLGVVFRQFFTGRQPPDLDASQDETIEAHRELLNDLMQEHGYAAIDVLNVSSRHSRLEKLLSDFQTEHHHPEDQARLFLAGRGTFYLRAQIHDQAAVEADIKANSRAMIYALDCGPGDFVTLPATLAHWFELDTRKAFCTVRLFACAQSKHSIPTGPSQTQAAPSPRIVRSG